jgi:hypothetical protein
VSQLDALIAVCRQALHDPPNIATEAQRELMALRDELRAMRQALECSAKPTEQEARLQAEAIAAKYSYWHRSGSAHGMAYVYAGCDELRDADITVADMNTQTAMRRVKEAAVDHVAEMLRNGETTPPPRGEHG